MSLIVKLLKSTILLMMVIVSVISCSFQSPHNYSKTLGVITKISAYKNLINQDPSHTLVDLEDVIPGIALDIRYATTNNFTREIIYDSPKAFVRKPMAEALAEIQAELKNQDLALKIFDAYRPYSATVRFYEVYPDTNFVAAPWKGSVHNRGCAIDLTLIKLSTGEELEMPTPFDDFTKKAAHSYMDLPKVALRNRTMLHDIMIKHGFTKYDYEWWHYYYKGWKNYQLMDITFEELNK